MTKKPSSSCCCSERDTRSSTNKVEFIVKLLGYHHAFVGPNLCRNHLPIRHVFDLMKFSKLPEIANYFQDPTELIYDTRLDLRVNLDHIIDDNITRFPAQLQSIDKSKLSVVLGGTIEDAKKRVKRNYKTAIPQYYDGKIQLLLPLCITSKSNADLALVVERGNNVYRASTCLTLDMAINNARLIAKPDDEWLKI